MSDAEKQFYVDLTDGRETAVDLLIDAGSAGSSLKLMLGSVRTGADAEGQLQIQGVILSRLRLDLKLAKQVHEILGQHIENVEAKPSGKMN